MLTADTVTDPLLGHVVQSEARVRENRRLLAQTRYQIAVSRRCLNQAFAVSGASDEDEHLRVSVRARLNAGILRPLNGQCWAGSGSGRTCVVCGAPIQKAQVEYEVDGPRGTVAVHLACFAIWRRESEALHEDLPDARGAILGTLAETHGDCVVLTDGSRIVLSPRARCPYPPGTRLQIVYAQSEGKKVALSIERYQWG